VECTHKTSEKKETHAFIDWSFYLILHIRLDYSIYKHPLSYTHKDWRAFKQEQKKKRFIRRNTFNCTTNGYM